MFSDSLRFVFVYETPRVGHEDIQYLFITYKKLLLLLCLFVWLWKHESKGHGGSLLCTFLLPKVRDLLMFERQAWTILSYITVALLGSVARESNISEPGSLIHLFSFNFFISFHWVHCPSKEKQVNHINKCTSSIPQVLFNGSQWRWPGTSFKTAPLRVTSWTLRPSSASQMMFSQRWFLSFYVLLITLMYVNMLIFLISLVLISYLML